MFSISLKHRVLCYDKKLDSENTYSINKLLQTVPVSFLPRLFLNILCTKDVFLSIGSKVLCASINTWKLRGTTDSNLSTNVNLDISVSRLINGYSGADLLVLWYWSWLKTSKSRTYTQWKQTIWCRFIYEGSPNLDDFLLMINVFRSPVTDGLGSERTDPLSFLFGWYLPLGVRRWSSYGAVAEISRTIWYLPMRPVGNAFKMCGR